MAKRKTKTEVVEAPVAAVEPAPVITSIKGFDSNLSCRGFQFEIGRDVLSRGQDPGLQKRVSRLPDRRVSAFRLRTLCHQPARVSRRSLRPGATDRAGTKLASASVTIGLELSISDLVARAVKWVFDRSKPEGKEATGYRGAASATGDSGAASATGDRGAASATGDSGAASATGDSGAASATGYRGAASATGDRGAASATGYRGAASATGDRGAASATGYSGAASATGDSGAASATGKHSVALAIGFDARAMATETNALCLVHRDDRTGAIIAIRASKCGENGIDPGVYYTLSATGEFVRAE